jgi:hypothetical protein
VQAVALHRIQDDELDPLVRSRRIQHLPGEELWQDFQVVDGVFGEHVGHGGLTLGARPLAAHLLRPGLEPALGLLGHDVQHLVAGAGDIQGELKAQPGLADARLPGHEVGRAGDHLADAIAQPAEGRGEGEFGIDRVIDSQETVLIVHWVLLLGRVSGISAKPFPVSNRAEGGLSGFVRFLASGRRYSGVRVCEKPAGARQRIR